MPTKAALIDIASAATQSARGLVLQVAVPGQPDPHLTSTDVITSLLTEVTWTVAGHPT
jgi:hypothetical protein